MQTRDHHNSMFSSAKIVFTQTKVKFNLIIQKILL